MRIALALLGCAGLILLGCPAPDPDVPEIAFAEFHSEEYGFSFQYPDTLSVETYTPEHIVVGRRVGDRFDSYVQIGLFQAYPHEAEPGTFETFARERARMLCAADGAGMSADCTDVTDSSSFTAVDGLEGEVFHFRHEVVELATTEVVERSTRGPFVAIDVSAQLPDAPVAVLIVHPPVVLEPEEVDEDLVRTVAETVRFVALAPGPEPAEQYAYVHGLVDENDEPALIVDFVEWVDDPQAVEGFRVENPLVMLDTIPVAPDVTINLLSPPDAQHIDRQVTLDEFEEAVESDVAYRLEFRGPQITAITDIAARTGGP